MFQNLLSIVYEKVYIYAIIELTSRRVHNFIILKNDLNIFLDLNHRNHL